MSPKREGKTAQRTLIAGHVNVNVNVNVNVDVNVNVNVFNLGTAGTEIPLSLELSELRQRTPRRLSEAV